MRSARRRLCSRLCRPSADKSFMVRKVAETRNALGEIALYAFN